MIINTGLPLAGGGVRFSSGSYVGTGTFGADNPCSVDVGFEPKLFFVFRRGKLTASQFNDDLPWGPKNTAFWIAGFDSLLGFEEDSNTVDVQRPATVSGTVISWYLEKLEGISNIRDSTKIEYQLNYPNTTYCWFALG